MQQYPLNFFDMFSSMGFHQFVSEPTRLNINGAGNILDLVLCNNPLSVNVDCVREPFSTSDHCIIDFSVFVDNFTPAVLTSHDGINKGSGNASVLNSSTNDITLPVPDWPKADFDAINDALCAVDWHLLFGYCFDADTIWSSFKNIVWPIIVSFVPNVLVRHNLKYKPRLYSKHIKSLLRRKAAIWRKLRSDPLLYYLKNIERLRNHTNTLLLNLTLKRSAEF